MMHRRDGDDDGKSLLSDEEFTAATIHEYLESGQPYDEAGARRVWAKLKTRQRQNRFRQARYYTPLAACGVMAIAAFQYLQPSTREKGMATPLALELQMFQGNGRDDVPFQGMPQRGDKFTFRATVPAQCLAILVEVASDGVARRISDAVAMNVNEEVAFEGQKEKVVWEYSENKKQVCGLCFAKAEDLPSEERLGEAASLAPDTACIRF